MSSQSPRLFHNVARPHRLRDAGVVALWAALVGGFIAHATVPAPGAPIAASPQFAEAAEVAQPREPAVPAVAQGRRAPRAVAVSATLGPLGAYQPCAAELPDR